MKNKILSSEGSLRKDLLLEVQPGGLVSNIYLLTACVQEQKSQNSNITDTFRSSVAEHTHPCWVQEQQGTLPQLLELGEDLDSRSAIQ